MCGTEKQKISFSILHAPLLVLDRKFGRNGLENPGVTLRGVRLTPGSLGSSILSKRYWGSSMFSIVWSSWYSPIRSYGLEES